MALILLYIFKSTICLILFYIGFKALLSNDTFFRFNRYVLLGGVTVCLILPFVKLHTSEPTLIQQPIRHLEIIISGDEILNEYPEKVEMVEMPSLISEPAVGIDWGWMIGLIYLSGVFFCLAVTLFSFCKMFSIIRGGRKIPQSNSTLILTPGPVAPFSWGRYIILSEDDYNRYPEEILTHERMHLQARHSWDLIFMEVILWLHWFNPAIWLLKRELKEIHEYQADKSVLKQGIDATKYQLLLVKKAVGSSHYTLANSFNHSKIKKRITMMLKGKSNSWARLKLLLLVPVGLIALNAFARPEINRQLETLVQSKDSATPLNDQQDFRELFRSELNKYLREKGGIANPSDEDKKDFLEKETKKQVLLVNALGQILLNNKYVQNKDLPEKLQHLFEQSLIKNEKPIAFYSVIDKGVPLRSLANTLAAVNNAFLKQQEEIGLAKAPILFYEDNSKKKNVESNAYWVNPYYVYFYIDGKKVSLEEYKHIINKAIRGTHIKSELNDAEGKVIEVIPHFKRKNGSVVPDEPVYFELAPQEDALQ